MMKFLRSTSIRARLLLLSGILCLFTAGTAFLGYKDLVAMEADMDSLYKDALLPVYWINDTRSNIQAVRANLYALMLTDDDAENQALLADIRRRSELNNRNLENYGKLDLDPFEIDRLAQANKNLAEGRQSLGRTIELAMANKNAEAYAYWLQEGLVSLNRLNEDLVALSAYCAEWADKKNQENREEAAAGIRILVLLAVSAVLFGLLFGFLIAVSVMKSLAGLREGVDRFAEGDLTVRFDESGRDEITLVARSLAGMAAKLRSAMRSIAGASETLGSSAEEFSALSEESNAGVEESRAGVDDVSSQMESLAAASQEINASVEEVASGAQSSAQKGTEMAGEVEQARLAGEDGTKAVEKVVRSITKVAEALDLLRGTFGLRSDAVDAGDRLFDRFRSLFSGEPRLFDLGRHLGSLLRGGLRAARHFLDGGVYLFTGRGQTLHLGGDVVHPGARLLDSGVRFLGEGCELLGVAPQLFRGRRNGAHRLALLRHHLGERVGHYPEFVSCGDAELFADYGEVAVAGPPGEFDDRPQRCGDAPGDEEAEEKREHDGGEYDADDHVEGGQGVLIVLLVHGAGGILAVVA